MRGPETQTIVYRGWRHLFFSLLTGFVVYRFVIYFVIQCAVYSRGDGLHARRRLKLSLSAFVKLRQTCPV
jgi:hypothetical protein